MLEAIEEPNRAACKNLYNENIELFKSMPGSSHNHQAWPGGYHDHITEVMNICLLLYPIYNVRQLNFTLGDALLVMFLHDLEKPWRRQLEYVETNNGYGFNVIDKTKRKEFRLNKIKEYGIELTEKQQNALQYVEGENKDYDNGRRVMNELAAFCHIADVTSSRIYWSYGKENKW